MVVVFYLSNPYKPTTTFKLTLSYFLVEYAKNGEMAEWFKAAVY